MRGGWAEPVTLTAEQVELIRSELANRRPAAFKSAERQNAFLRRIEGALTMLKNGCNTPADPYRRQQRVDNVSKSLDRLRTALAGLEQPERDAIEHGQDGELHRFERDMERLRVQVTSAQDALKMPRGAHDAPPGGRVRLLVALMADAWEPAFERKPSPKPESAFFEVVNVVLGQIGEREIGKDALKTILKGAGSID